MKNNKRVWLLIPISIICAVLFLSGLIGLLNLIPADINIFNIIDGIIYTIIAATTLVALIIYLVKLKKIK